MSLLSPALRKTLLRALEALAWLVCLGGAFALVRTGRAYGHDFRVFYEAAVHLVSGRPLYDVVRDGAMSFKYPPWTAFAFTPLALLPQDWAGWMWACLQPVSLAAIFVWARRQALSKWAIYAVAILFWGIWIPNAIDGQVNLPVLAIALWVAAPRRLLGPNASQFRSPSWTLPVVAGLLSTKVFGVVGLVGFPLSRWTWPKSLAKFFAATAFGVVVLSLLPLLSGSHASLSSLWDAWISAASSGGTQFGDHIIRGRLNQGLPSLPLKALGVSAAKSSADVISFFAVASVVLGGLIALRRRFDPLSFFVTGLALVPALHPLAWPHVFGFAAPLSILVLDRGFRVQDKARRRRCVRLTVMGIAMLGLMTSKTMGPLGEALEFLSVKSFGVLMLLSVVVLIGPPAVPDGASVRGSELKSC